MNASTYRHFFGLTKEPFPNEVDLKDIYQTLHLAGAAQRFEYAVSIGAMAWSPAISAPEGPPHKSMQTPNSIRPSIEAFTSSFRPAPSCNFLEKLGLEMTSASGAFLLRNLKRILLELINGKKLKPVLIVDEASLMKLEVFDELHTITLFDRGQKAKLPVILAGQNNLIDKPVYRSSRPLASRIVARTYLQSADRDEMQQYIIHHLNVAGVDRNLFEEAAFTSIHQRSGGLSREANHMARCALIATAAEKQDTVAAEHGRLAATEIFKKTKPKLKIEKGRINPGLRLIKMINTQIMQKLRFQIPNNQQILAQLNRNSTNVKLRC